MTQHPYQPWILTLLATGITATLVILLAALTALIHNVQKIRDLRRNTSEPS